MLGIFDTIFAILFIVEMILKFIAFDIVQRHYCSQHSIIHLQNKHYFDLFEFSDRRPIEFGNIGLDGAWHNNEEKYHSDCSFLMILIRMIPMIIRKLIIL